MHIPILIFEYLVALADAIIYVVFGFFLMILVLFAFATADGDDYWAEGGMPLPDETQIESTEEM